MFDTEDTAGPVTGDALAADLVALLARVAEGDHKAFRRLYERTHRKLFGVALLLVRQREAAEDIVQDAFVRIWAKAGSFDATKGQPLPWMARIVRNIVFDHFRRRVIGTVELDAEQHDMAAEPGLSVVDLSQVTRCLDGLDPVHRAAWWMIHLDGRSLKEVASTMNVPLGTVKTWVFRSSRMIRAAVEG